MIKLKNIKFLILMIICIFTTQNTWGGSKYYSYHNIDVKPSGAGKVYSTTKTDNGQNTNFNACVDPPYVQTWHTGNSTNTLYLLAKANDGYVFSHWEDQDGTTVSTTNPGQVSARCAQTSTSGPGDYNGTYYAIFLSTQAVEVYTENADYGTASISNAENNVGDIITLTAHENLFQHAFVGWRKEVNGEIVSTDNPYTFEITDQNKGKYYAVFRDDYYFYRIQNYATKRYMVAIGDQGGLADLSSFSLVNGKENVLSNAGSIVQVRIHFAETTAKTREYAFIVQGEDTQEITNAYLRMDRIEANELTLWEPNADGIRARDNGGVNVNLALTSSADNTKWYFEKLDLDLSGENYFSLDPDKLVEVGGKYYTTLRTSWNILFNPEQMTPYIVSNVDEAAGTFEMEPLTGNIIPAGTPVVIETKSNDIEENRMVPTLTAAASGAVPSDNQLISSTKYFPNQNAPYNNCKALTVNNGKLVFGGNALSKVNGNEAYLRVANEVALEKETPETPEVTLAELLASGDTQNTYIVTDLTAVRIVNNDQMIIAKDNNGYATKEVMPAEGDYVDYMHTATGITNNDLNIDVPDEYDQSNWIALRVPAGTSPATSLQGQHLTGVKGRLVNTVNPEFALDEMPGGESEGAASTALNTFIPASFSGTQTSTVGSQKTYFFVQPKPMEMANITWAQWDGEKFIAPVHDEAHSLWNTAELVGSFELNAAYLEDQQGGGLDVSTLKSGHVYAMTPAVIKKKTGDYNHVYVLGNVNGLNEGVWNPNKGVEMETNDGITYTAIVNVNDATNDNMQDYGYFSFTKKLGASWEDISSYRFGAVSNGNYWVTSLGNTINLTTNNGQALRIDEGRYLLKVNLNAMTLVITAAPSQAPRREGAAQQYVVYPVTMTKITAENENGVVTGVSTVGGDRVAVSRQYVNVAGVRASQPWNGVNIVITTYSDGTTTATKIVK